MEPHELERLRRSIAMLAPGQLALSRENALALLDDVQDMQRQLARVRAELERRLGELA